MSETDVVEKYDNSNIYYDEIFDEQLNINTITYSQDTYGAGFVDTLIATNKRLRYFIYGCC